jgi:hypothetical protein
MTAFPKCWGAKWTARNSSGWIPGRGAASAVWCNLNDLIERIVNAIIRQEGMPADYPNPGNLRAAPWISSNVVMHNGFWLPSSRAQGVAGAAHVVALRIAEGQTLRQLISAWAPPSDGNQTELYISHVQAWASIPDPDAVLWTLMTDPDLPAGS